MTSLGFSDHDHGACIASAISQVEAVCVEHGLRLTKVRRRVLELLLERHAALGAYDILDVLKSEGLGSQPPIAYRALDFLVSHGFAHKIEKLNAFVACTTPGRDHAPAFLICRACDAVSEDADVGLVQDAVAKDSFSVETAVIELEGVCAKCQTRDGL